MLVTSIFSFFHNVFKRLLSSGASNVVNVRLKVNDPQKRGFGNTVGKKEKYVSFYSLSIPPAIPRCGVKPSQEIGTRQRADLNSV